MNNPALGQAVLRSNHTRPVDHVSERFDDELEATLIDTHSATQSPGDALVAQADNRGERCSRWLREQSLVIHVNAEEHIVNKILSCNSEDCTPQERGAIGRLYAEHLDCMQQLHRVMENTPTQIPLWARLLEEKLAPWIRRGDDRKVIDADIAELRAPAPQRSTGLDAADNPPLNELLKMLSDERCPAKRAGAMRTLLLADAFGGTVIGKCLSALFPDLNHYYECLRDITHQQAREAQKCLDETSLSLSEKEDLARAVLQAFSLVSAMNGFVFAKLTPNDRALLNAVAKRQTQRVPVKVAVAPRCPVVQRLRRFNAEAPPPPRHEESARFWEQPGFRLGLAMGWVTAIGAAMAARASLRGMF